MSTDRSCCFDESRRCLDSPFVRPNGLVLLTASIAESGESNSVHIKTSPSRFADAGEVSVATRLSDGGNGGKISLLTGTSAGGMPGLI